MWFKNCQLFQFAEPCTLTVEGLTADLTRKIFVPLGNTDQNSMGWVAPNGEEEGMLVHAGNGNLLVCLKKSEKVIPSSVVKEMLMERIAHLEETTGRKIRKNEKNQLKDEIFHSLLPRAFSRSSLTYAYIDTLNGFLVVDASSPRKAEGFTEFLRKTIGSLKIQLPELQSIPTLLNDWVIKNRYPSEFTIEDSCVLQSNKEKGMIRCQKQNLFSEEILSLIKSGREIAQLRMSWCDQLSFILKEDFSVCSIKFLEGVKSQADEVNAEDRQARFDADFCIMTETFQHFFKQLLTVFAKSK